MRTNNPLSRQSAVEHLAQDCGTPSFPNRTGDYLAYLRQRLVEEEEAAEGAASAEARSCHQLLAQKYREAIRAEEFAREIDDYGAL